MRNLFRDYGPDVARPDRRLQHTFTYYLPVEDWDLDGLGPVATGVLLAADNSPTGGSLTTPDVRSPDVLGPDGATELFVSGPDGVLRQMHLQRSLF